VAVDHQRDHRASLWLIGCGGVAGNSSIRTNDGHRVRIN